MSRRPLLDTAVRFANAHGIATDTHRGAEQAHRKTEAGPAVEAIFERVRLRASSVSSAQLAINENEGAAPFEDWHTCQFGLLFYLEVPTC